MDSTMRPVVIVLLDPTSDRCLRFFQASILRRPDFLLFQAAKAGKVKIPIGRKLTLKDADQGHAAAAKGGAGKLLLVVDKGEHLTARPRIPSIY